MTWFWGFLILFFVLMAISLGIAYAAGKSMLGREAIQRNLRYALLWIFLGFAIGLIIPLFGKYALLVFKAIQILYVVGLSGWLISWLFRRNKAGSLLLDTGRTLQNNLLLGCGLLEIVLMGFLTLAELPRYFGLNSKAFDLIFWWSFPVLFIALGLSKLEFRANGICCMLSFIPWERIRSYTWDRSKPSTLTIRIKREFPLFLGFMSILVPTNYRDAVSQLLSEKLPNKSLG